MQLPGAPCARECGYAILNAAFRCLAYGKQSDVCRIVRLFGRACAKSVEEAQIARRSFVGDDVSVLYRPPGVPGYGQELMAEVSTGGVF